MTVSPEVEAEIRRLFFAEHWPVGTIARQLGVHEDVVRRLAGLLSPKRVVPSQPLLVTPYVDFIGDVLAAVAAKKGQKVPVGHYIVDVMLKNVMRHEGEVAVCGTCMNARGIAEGELEEGCPEARTTTSRNGPRRASACLSFECFSVTRSDG